jgi:Matrixin
MHRFGAPAVAALTLVLLATGVGTSSSLAQSEPRQVFAHSSSKSIPLLAPVAHASWRLEHAANHALRFWHGYPPCGRPSASYGRVPRRFVGYSWKPTCSILVSPRFRRRYRLTCVAVLHEWGHLMGRHHSRSKSSIMYSKFTPHMLTYCP